MLSLVVGIEIETHPITACQKWLFIGGGASPFKPRPPYHAGPGYARLAVPALPERGIPSAAR